MIGEQDDRPLADGVEVFNALELVGDLKAFGERRKPIGSSARLDRCNEFIELDESQEALHLRDPGRRSGGAARQQIEECRVQPSAPEVARCRASGGA